MHSLRIGAGSLLAVLLILIASLAVPLLTPSIASAALVQDQEEGADGGAEESDGADPVSGVESVDGALSVGIDAGACATPDSTITGFPLSPAAPAGSSPAGAVFTSETEIAVPLSDLLAVPHAVAVGIEDDVLSIPIACADIAGAIVGGKLVVGLLAADSGELTGVAVLGETDSGTTTLVEIYVILAGASGPDEDSGDDDDEEDTVDGEGGV